MAASGAVGDPRLVGHPAPKSVPGLPNSVKDHVDLLLLQWEMSLPATEHSFTAWVELWGWF